MTGIDDAPAPKGLVPTHGPRRRARIACVQALYRADVVGDSLSTVREEVAADTGLPEEARDYAGRLLWLVEERGAEIDVAISAALTRWDLKRLAVIDRAVLRMATAEVLFAPEVPVQVLLNEAIEIAKRFGSNESGRFVNGVMDRVARERRTEEAE